MPSLLQRPIGIAVCVGVATLLFQLPFFDRWLSMMDEGHVVHFADLVAKGGVLYRDATIYPLPGAFYLLSLVYRVVEPSLLVARWVVAIEFAAFAAAFAVLLRGWLRPAFVALGVGAIWLYRIWAFPHWQIYSYSTTALLLFLLALLLLLRFLERGHVRALAGAGTLFGLGVFCKQDYGAATMLGVILTLTVYGRSAFAVARLDRLLAWFFAPAALVGAAAGVHFLYLGVLQDALQMSVLNPFLAHASDHEYMRFPSVWPLLRQDPALHDWSGVALSYYPGILFTALTAAVFNSWVFRETAIADTLVKLFYYGPILLLLGGGWRLWKRRGALDQTACRRAFFRELTVWSHASALIVLVWLQVPQDYLHMAVLYAPILILLVVYADDFWGKNRLGSRFVVIVGVGLFIVAAGYSVHLVVSLRERYSQPIPLARAGVRITPPAAALLSDLVTYTRAETRPEEPLPVMPYAPLIHFLSDRQAPHRLSYIMWPFSEFPDRDRKIIDAMERANSQLVIYDQGQFRGFPPFEEYVPDLFRYLVEQFEIDRVFTHPGPASHMLALRRTQARETGQRLAAPTPQPDGVWAEGPDGARRGDSAESLLRTVDWPFRPVWALRPTAAGGRTVLSYPFSVPRNATLETAIATHPRFWFRFRPTSTTFVLEVEDATGRHVVFSKVLDPHRKPADRRWHEASVDLRRWAGKGVVLRFSTATQAEIGENLDAAAWEVPRIVSPPDGTGGLRD